ncbi:RagB/SusD family nutrient uptake outer membrane protein [Chitinophaga pendula]|uniref:RagB/SusD family nutrient uptake outer membrane protein n=1 Tax=Chitinophaga TaxID=79328 RepID=UPI000BAF4C3C|nr:MULTISPECIES: RagB/SusD family nutrient uptake outer membrane protein [Chitinophaga]ASZ12031.1 RagB/SusD family nutrient uptake outer membrane protein [Chitinophaga sp. MD30]UCJ04936.1 RagB/SusD family nutrient uptake outer membrane protein [Chitinophaga pendula]
MIKKFPYQQLLYATLLAAAMTACNKFVDVPLPNNQITTAAAFGDDGKANSSMRGIYASTQNVWSQGPLSGLLSTSFGLASDELVRLSYSADQQNFLDNNLTATSEGAASIWSGFYNMLYQINVLLENVQKSPGISAPVKQQLTGEACFLRAYCYFYMVNTFGDVPLSLTSDYRVNAILGRTPADKVYEQILTDLASAQAQAGDQYTTAGNRLRANKWAATAMLARVQLYRKNWTEAEKQAGNVIQSGLYQLDSLNNVFLISSKEAILQIANPGTNKYTMEINRLTGNATNPSCRFSHYLSAAFEKDDQRITRWTLKASNGDTAYYKYQVNDNNNPKTEALTLLRLAEQYLIRAEARAWQGKLQEAIADLDVVRKRAGITLLANTSPGISKEELLQAIAKERMTELFGEQGHRWFDVKRSGLADALYSIRKPNWNKNAILLPIPRNERLKNPNLTQNEGYE